MPVKVIVDANFLMLPSQFHIDINSELQRILNRQVKLIVLSPVQDELRRLYNSAPQKTSRQAENALKTIQGQEVIKIKPNPEETVDDLIIRIAKELKYPVATNDRVLRKKLKSLSIPVIYLRQGNRLQAEGILP